MFMSMVTKVTKTSGKLYQPSSSDSEYKQVLGCRA
jgi:hypothetical protein